MRILLALCLLLASLPASAAVLGKNAIGVLTTAQTGNTNSTDQVKADNADQICFEIVITGACVASITNRVEGGTNFQALPPGSTTSAPIGNGTCNGASTAGSNICCVQFPTGRYGVVTSGGCAGSVTVNYQWKSLP
jgi:hypothetical protein